jgi:hypothetical protein
MKKNKSTTSIPEGINMSNNPVIT